MNDLITIIAGGSIVTAALIWLAKSIISKAIDTGGDVFKNKLDKELEVHKKNMDMMKIQYQIQYSSLQEKRGEVIAELYSLLYDLEQDLRTFTSVGQTDWLNDLESDKIATKTLEKTTAFFEKNRIYFEQGLCDKLEEILIERREVIKEMRKAKVTAKQLRENTDLKIADDQMPMSKWFEQEDKVKGQIADSRKQLADEFRVLFGIEIKSQEKENN